MAKVSSKVFGLPSNEIEKVAGDNVTRTVTGSVSESAGNIVKYVLRGGVLGANDSIRIRTFGSLPANTANTQFVIRFGGATNTAGTIIFNNTLGNTMRTFKHVHEIFANNSMTSQKAFNATDEEAHKESTASMVTASEDLTTDTNIWINAVAGTAGDIVNLERYRIEIVRA